LKLPEKNFNVNNGGFALLSVLIIIAILTPLVVNLGYRSRVSLAGTDFFVSKIKSREIAWSGVISAITALKNDSNNYDSELEEWGRYKEMAGFSSSFFDEGSFSGYITDEAGKFNVNRLFETGITNLVEPLERLFEQIQIDDDIIYTMIDWMDENHDHEGVTGAEDDYYSSQKNPYYSKDSAMDSIYELRLIKGITDDIFLDKEGRSGLNRYLTVFGGDRLVNINTAPKEVLLALSSEMDEKIVDEIIDYREGAAFQKISDLQNLPAMDNDTYDSIKSIITVNSSYFSIYVRGSVRNVVTELRVIVKRDKGKIRIIQFSEV